MTSGRDVTGMTVDEGNHPQIDRMISAIFRLVNHDNLARERFDDKMRSLTRSRGTTSIDHQCIANHHQFPVTFW